MDKVVAIVATLDTKREEAFFVRSLLSDWGNKTTVIDVGALTSAQSGADFTNRQVAHRAGWQLDDLVAQGQRDRIMDAMGEGARSILLGLQKTERLGGVIGIGGNQGTAIAAAAMRPLKFGLPKFLVSTVASGDIRPFIGHNDINILFSVGDMLAGPNDVTRTILKNAAAALDGMVRNGEIVVIDQDRPAVAISELGNTEKAAALAAGLLKNKGMQVIPFHASGAGGSAMEALIAQGHIAGLFDLTPHELSEEYVGLGSYVPVRPGRMSAAAKKGIPQVVSFGGLEYVCFGPRESIPFKMRRRKIVMHNPVNANVKLTRAEMAAVGNLMADRLNASTGPVAVMAPLGGWSVYGAPGGPLYDAVGNKLLLTTLKQNLKPEIDYREIDAHINDPKFVGQCVDRLLEFMEG